MKCVKLPQRDPATGLPVVIRVTDEEAAMRVARGDGVYAPKRAFKRLQRSRPQADRMIRARQRRMLLDAQRAQKRKAEGSRKFLDMVKKFGAKGD